MFRGTQETEKDQQKKGSLSLLLKAEANTGPRLDFSQPQMMAVASKGSRVLVLTRELRFFAQGLGCGSRFGNLKSEFIDLGSKILGSRPDGSGWRVLRLGLGSWV